MGGYGALLGQLAAGAGAAAAPAGPGAPRPTGGGGLGMPPQMPGLPPAPTGIGKVDTGLGSGNPREAASDAVLKLRELKGHYPSAATQIDGMIQAIIALGKPGGAAGMPGANDGVAVADAASPPPAPSSAGGMDAE